MLKSSLLSDDTNIQAINRDFVPVSFMNEAGFPSDIPAFAPIREAFLSNADYKGFFSTVVVLDPSGTMLLGYTGRSYPPNYKPTGSYTDGRFIKNLQRSLERYERVKAIEADSSLTAEQKSAKLADVQREVRSAIAGLKTLHAEIEHP
jgi:hypothetical protein